MAKLKQTERQESISGTKKEGTNLNSTAMQLKKKSLDVVKNPLPSKEKRFETEKNEIRSEPCKEESVFGSVEAKDGSTFEYHNTDRVLNISATVAKGGVDETAISCVKQFVSLQPSPKVTNSLYGPNSKLARTKTVSKHCSVIVNLGDSHSDPETNGEKEKVDKSLENYTEKNTLRVSFSNYARYKRSLQGESSYHFKKYLEENQLNHEKLLGADLSKLDLSKSDYSGLDLTKVSFAQTNLEDVNFVQTILEQTIMTNSTGLSVEQLSKAVWSSIRCLCGEKDEVNCVKIHAASLIKKIVKKYEDELSEKECEEARKGFECEIL